jgi:hypothetical protein
VTVAELQPRRHDAPAGWSVEVFEQVTDALAAALIGAYRRQQEALVKTEAGR